MQKIYFFGAGKDGKYWLECFQDFGIVPQGFIDNNKELQGTSYKDIMIYAPNDLKNFSFDYIYITCNDTGEIYQQLLTLKVKKNKIVTRRYNILNHLLYHIRKNNIFINRIEEYCDKTVDKKIIIDLYNGMVLGGVETWSYDLAKQFKKNGYQGVYLTTDISAPTVIDETYPVECLTYKDLTKEKVKIEQSIQKIIQYLPCTIICNFPQHIFLSACVVKQLYPDQIKIIAVQHSDDLCYYETYCLWKDYIEQCLVISSHIKNKLLSLGMEKQKICYIEWQVNCDKYLRRVWNKNKKKLQIGYAGRITITAKRADLLLDLAIKLKEKIIDFQINIAGIGDYSEILQRRIQEENLQDYIVLTGYINRKNISDFWKKQDIMVNCSEWEGHSISQSEAMAEGVVPIITDVSGAKDDVTDGCNGFIVAVNDIEAMAEKINYLYDNGDKLEQMGICAHRVIYNRKKSTNYTEFWGNLLKKIWE